jgi:hypothetical protein
MHLLFVAVATPVPVEFFGIAVILLAIVVWIAWKLSGEWRRSREPLFDAIEKSHPVLGTYMDRFTHWTAAVPGAEGVDGTLGISAQGRDPTDLQLQKLEDIRGRLPGILTKLSPFVSAPRIDSAGNPLPSFQITAGKLMHLAVGEDGGFHARVSPAECPEFKLKLVLEVSREEKLTLYTWEVPEGFPWEGRVQGDDHDEPRWTLNHPAHGLGEDVEVQGPGQAPAADQLSHLEEIKDRLPALLGSLAPLAGSSANDSRRDLQPGFDLAAARLHRLYLLQDREFTVELCDSNDAHGWQYWMILELTIDRDWKLVEYQWSV